MSRRVEKKVTAVESNLARVIRVGHENREAGGVGCGCYGQFEDETLSPDEFVAAVDEIVDIQARGMTRQDRDRFKTVAKNEAKKRTSQAGRLAKSGAKEAGKLTRASAQALVTEVNIMWKGANKPAHWLKLSAQDLAARFKKSLRISLTKPAWANILKAPGGDRYYTCDSAANCHADLHIIDASGGSDGTIRCRVFIKFKEDPETDEEIFLSSIGDQIFGEATENLGDAVTMSFIKYDEILKRCDRCLDVATKHMKDKLANFM